MDIDRTSETPFYLQLATILQQQIAAGTFEPNGRLPSESALCRDYDLSRSTVRETLRSLEQQRVIRMVPRRGAFVNTNAEEDGWSLQVTRGFLEVSSEQGDRVVDTRVLRSGFEVLPPEVCRRLKLPVGSQGFVLERLRALDGELVMHSTNYLPEDIGQSLLGRPVLDGQASLNRTLMDLGIVIRSARRDVVAVAATAKVAALLDCAEGQPLVLVESLSLCDNERPFDCYYSYVRTDRLKISIEAHSAEES